MHTARQHSLCRRAQPSAPVNRDTGGGGRRKKKCHRRPSHRPFILRRLSATKDLGDTKPNFLFPQRLLYIYFFSPLVLFNVTDHLLASTLTGVYPHGVSISYLRHGPQRCLSPSPNQPAFFGPPATASEL